MRATSTTRRRIWLGMAVGAVVASFALALALLCMKEDWSGGITATEVEEQWGEILLPLFLTPRDFELGSCEAFLQAMVDSLHSTDPSHPVRVYLSARETVNAVTLPGGNIIVYRGLLQEVQSENELAMILAHELGHVAERHSTEVLRRRAVLLMLYSAVYARAPVLGDILARAGELNELRFSREAELEADQIALRLLARRYGHVGGATDFFEREVHKESKPAFELLRSHPLSQGRIDALKQAAAQNGWPEHARLSVPLPCCVSE